MEMNGISSPGSLIPKVRTWTRLSLSPLSVLEFMTLKCSPASAAENQGPHRRTDAVAVKEAWQVSTQDAGPGGWWVRSLAELGAGMQRLRAGFRTASLGEVKSG